MKRWKRDEIRKAKRRRQKEATKRNRKKRRETLEKGWAPLLGLTEKKDDKEE